MTSTLEERIGQRLRERGWTLAAAESATGGLIGHRLTNVPGSSDYYLGSVTAYAYRVKVRLTGISWETLETHGAVSEEAVREMASGIREILDADIGLAVSGIAGPTGGTPQKPVGTLWIGLSTPNQERTLSVDAGGNRMENKTRFAQAALEFLDQTLERDGTH